MKIEHFRPNERGGPLKASYQVICRPTGLWHFNLCFFQKEGGQTWFGYPNREYKNKEGERKFFKQAYPDEPDRPAFEKEMMEALTAQCPVMKDILAGEMQPQPSSFASNSFENLPF